MPNIIRPELPTTLPAGPPPPPVGVSPAIAHLYALVSLDEVEQLQAAVARVRPLLAEHDATLV